MLPLPLVKICYLLLLCLLWLRGLVVQPNSVEVLIEMKF